MIKTIMKRIRYILHRLGFHNKECRRRVYTTKKDYLCLITGKIYKKFKL